jgi:FG-GAP-like repeat
MKRKLLWVLMFGTVGLYGCGGGGSSGTPSYTQSGTSGPYARTQVPFSTPVMVGIVDPLINTNSNGYRSFEGDTFVANITGSGQDVIIAGRSTSNPDWVQSRISMFSWRNNSLVDTTAQWFPNNINVIQGTETNVFFADFFHHGRTDMFIAPGSDNSVVDNGPAYVFTNNGSSFSRQSIGTNFAVHGATIADLNQDGYTDLVILDRNTPQNSTLAINDGVSSFRTYTAKTGPFLFGSSVAAADFLNNGTTTLITTDNPTSAGNVQKLWGFNIANDQLTFSELGTLPTSRFNLPKWQALGIRDSHNIRVSAFDFNDDHVPDAIVFSQPGISPGVDISRYSEIQFLKNNGSGVFSDVTDSILVGYNTNTRTTYQPKFLDLNGDGLTDILVSGSDSTGTGSQFLLKSRDGKFVASYANVLTDYLKQIQSMSASDGNDATVNIIRAPDGRQYLVSYISFMNGSDRQLKVYTSLLGSSAVTTAVDAVALIKQTWPYMTDYQANLALARTTATYLNGIPVIDDISVLQPVGALNIPTLRGPQSIRGSISGLNIDSAQTIAIDSTGRYFSTNLYSMVTQGNNMFGNNTEHIDQYELSSHAEYLINGTVTTIPTAMGFDLRGGSEGRTWANTPGGTEDQGLSLLTKPTQYTIGIPDYYKNGAWSMGMQYTNLNYNPWIGFAGAWGEVVNSIVFDHVISYHDQGFVAKTSVMYVTTAINPGLITSVSPMTGGWAEMGYRYNHNEQFGDLGFYVGIKPVVFSGSVEAKLPTGIDNAGTINYTSQTLGVKSDVTGYARLLYNRSIDKHAQYRLSGTVLTNGEFRVMNELRLFLD